MRFYDIDIIVIQGILIIRKLSHRKGILMSMTEWNERMRKRVIEIAGRKIAELRTDAVIQETAWATIRTYRRVSLMLFCLGVFYLAVALFMKTPANIFVFLTIYALSLFAFIGSLLIRHRLSRGYYATTDSEVRDVIANLLSKSEQKRKKSDV